MKTLDRIIRSWRMNKAISFIPEGASVLDIGCGEGELLKILGNHIECGIGVDPRLLTSVKTPRYELIRGKWPQDVPASMIFDVVVLLAVIEHLPEEALRSLGDRCSRMMRSGGRLIITAPSVYTDYVVMLLRWLRLMDAEAFEEHHGFNPKQISRIIAPPRYSLYHHERFELGLNTLYVFERI
jgi:2-polyprenyl-3-methyl-5-hydroxy-6-metoxy-1,4-benzoquinol methylase